MAGIFTTLKKLSAEQQAAATAAYRDLVRLATEDAEYDAESAIEIIAEAGRNFDEFSADVERMAQRIADAKALQEAAEGIADYQAAQQRDEELVAEMNAKLDAVQQKYNKISDGERLDERLADSRLNRLESVQSAATNRLRETADPELRAEVDDLRKRIREHVAHCTSLEQRLQRVVMRANGVTDDIERARSQSMRAELQGELEHVRARQEELEREIKTARTTRMEALQDELRQAEAKFLLP